MLYDRILRRRSVLALLLTGTLSVAPGIMRCDAAPAKTAPSEDAKIVHLLNRLAFGPRPGDVEKVRQTGLERWIEGQLEPDGIGDALVERKLERLKTLQMPPQRLQLAYAADSAGFIKKLQQQGVTIFNQDGAAMPTPAAQNMPGPGADLNPRERQLLEAIQRAGLPQFLSIQAVGELQTDKVVRACESNRQLQEVLVDFWSNHFNLDVKKGPVRAYIVVDEREVIRPRVLGKFRDLLGASAKSPAMLWYLDNARSTREVAMPAFRRRQNQNQNPNNAAPDAPKKRGGLNENYAREVMELHTLGVDGGYSQKDVQEVARCFTGWSINRQTGRFQFNVAAHDNGPKVVLGRKIPAGGGQRDGETVLNLLASHPSTAKFIARKLCVRLVADEPPAALVDQAAQTFQTSGGDLKAVVRGIVTAPEFYAPPAVRAKIKSPFEFAVSAVRALGAEVVPPDPARTIGHLRLLADGGTALGREGKGGGARAYGRWQKSMAQQIAAMGQPLFSYQAPTGWPENSQEWVSAGALIARLNFALALTGGEVAGVQADPGSLLEGISGDNHDAVLDRLANRLLGVPLSPSTRATLQKQMTPGTPADPAKLTALVLGSPEFQRR